VTESATAQPAVVGPARRDLMATAGGALVVGAGLTTTALASGAALLCAVAVVQALFALAWVTGTGMPGGKGALVLAVMAGSAADVTVSVWPDGKLGALLAVLGLAVPVMFVHQLARGAARVEVVRSVAATAVLVLVVVAPAALIQLRHEFGSGDLAGKVTAMAVAAMAGALIVGCLVDLVAPLPRFDHDVPRGLLGVVAASAVGALVGYLMLREQTDFLGGRSAFVGAALGALTGLLAIAAAFAGHSAPGSGRGFVVRAGLSAVLPLALLSPVAFLLCLALRS
jgi:hypothetical protein